MIPKAVFHADGSLPTPRCARTGPVIGAPGRSPKTASLTVVSRAPRHAAL